MEPRVKCNKCGHVGDMTEFQSGYDVFRRPYVSGCPRCDNRQYQEDASFRLSSGPRPFAIVDDAQKA